MQIGLFDSGIGGVTVAKKVLRYLPQYSYTYYADDKHMPYGEKDSEAVYRYTTNSLRILFEQGCTLVILACNTATTVLPRIQHELLLKEFPDRKVLGVIRPTAEHIGITCGENVGIYLMATPRTVLSRAYDHELAKINSTCDLHEIPCTGLAAAIEHSDNVQTDPRIYSLCEKYVRDVPNDRPAVVYTACTHYAFAKRILRRLRPLARVVNQPSIVSRSLTQYLNTHPNIDSKLTKSPNGSIKILCSSHNPAYIQKIEHLLRA